MVLWEVTRVELMLAALLEIRDGFALAKNMNIKKLYIEHDAKTVVRILTSYDASSDLSHPCGTLISDCRTLLQCFEVAHIHHIYRKGNQCTDILEKEGSPINDSFILYSHPTPSIFLSAIFEC